MILSLSMGVWSSFSSPFSFSKMSSSMGSNKGESVSPNRALFDLSLGGKIILLSACVVLEDGPKENPSKGSQTGI